MSIFLALKSDACSGAGKPKPPASTPAKPKPTAKPTPAKPKPTEKPTPAPTPAPTSYPPDLNGCGSSVGDKFCDDWLNTAACKYDGGDCCGRNVDKTYCKECKCLDPKAKGK